MCIESDGDWRLRELGNIYGRGGEAGGSLTENIKDRVGTRALMARPRTPPLPCWPSSLGTLPATPPSLFSLLEYDWLLWIISQQIASSLESSQPMTSVFIIDPRGINHYHAAPCIITVRQIQYYLLEKGVSGRCVIAQQKKKKKKEFLIKRPPTLYKSSSPPRIVFASTQSLVASTYLQPTVCQYSRPFGARWIVRCTMRGATKKPQLSPACNSDVTQAAGRASRT